MVEEIPWKALSEVYGFAGNSLLKPMTQTASVGLDPAFWEAFPTFGSDEVEAALALCAQGAARIVAEADERGADAAERCAVEYPKLFIGPPSPAAPPWETMYRGEKVTVGFGNATFEMRGLLRDAGLEVRNENNQYEDHMGIELLYLSTLCARMAEGEGGEDGTDAGVAAPEAIASFIDEHPLAWVEAFRLRIAETAAGGYFDGLMGLMRAVLVWHRSMLYTTNASFCQS